MPFDSTNSQTAPAVPSRPGGASPEVDLLVEMGKAILQSAEVLAAALSGRTLVADGWQTIRDLEHKGDAVARDMFEMLMTPRSTVIPRDALKDLTGYLDDILDAIEAAAARLAIHRVRRALPAARELGEIVLESAQALQKALELRSNGDLFVHTRTLHRLENRGDEALRDAIAALFNHRTSARDIVKWKDICEILEASTDRCEDVANVLETILTQTGREERLIAGSLTMDLSRHDVQVAGEAVALSAKEFALLHLLLRHQGKVVRRERLLGEVWGQDYFGDTRTLDTHVGWLRKKVEGTGAVRIVAVRGVGYRLDLA